MPAKKKKVTVKVALFLSLLFVILRNTNMSYNQLKITCMNKIVLTLALVFGMTACGNNTAKNSSGTRAANSTE